MVEMVAMGELVKMVEMGEMVEMVAMGELVKMVEMGEMVEMVESVCCGCGRVCAAAVVECLLLLW